MFSLKGIVCLPEDSGEGGVGNVAQKGFAVTQMGVKF